MDTVADATDTYQTLLTMAAHEEVRALQGMDGLAGAIKDWLMAVEREVAEGIAPADDIEFRGTSSELHHRLNDPGHAGWRDRVARRGLLDKLAEWTRFRARQPSACEIGITRRVFALHGQTAAVEVEAVFEIDRAARTLTFLQFVSSPAGGAAEPEVIVGTAAWAALTERRAELIAKKNRAGLSEAEAAEYARLQAQSSAALARAFPPPRLAPDELALVKATLEMGGEAPHQ